MAQTCLRGNRRQRPAPSPHHPSFVPAAVLLGVGALLLRADPTGAQTLTVGSFSSATVSGAGTAVIGNFVTFGGGAGPGTSSYLTGSVINGALSLQNGGSFQNIQVSVGGTLNISGGTAGTVANQLGTNAIFNSISISGGTVTTVTNDRGSIGISGGTIQNVAGGAVNQTGPIVISGGNIQNVNTPGGLTIKGGTLGSVDDEGSPFSGGVTMTAGTVQSLSLNNAGGNSISGGSISSLTNIAVSSGTNISGGSFQFITNKLGTLNILGTNLKEFGTPTDANNDGTFQLLGLLSDGEALNVQYTQTGGTLEFNGIAATPTPVPEASTAATLGGLLLLGVAGLAFRARKRARA